MLSGVSGFGPERVWVTADQMRQIETLGFEAGMPVAALMEKVGHRLAARIQQLYPEGTIGILVGPGHNGGDALVVARELFMQRRQVQLYLPFSRFKPLTQQHRQYAEHLGIPTVDTLQQFQSCRVIVDGLFGFGLTRPITDDLAADIQWLNQSGLPVISLDLPSGIETDSGEPLGTAVRSHHTLCLGLWKRAFAQTAALPYLGQCERIDLDLPHRDLQAILGPTPTLQRLTPEVILQALPLERNPTVHKYSVGRLLLVAGSETYAGAAILAAQGAQASGVGMVTLAVPDALRALVVAQVPDALVVGCPAENGVIQALPDRIVPTAYDAIALGPGLTPQAVAVVTTLLPVAVPLVIDADGLNILAAQSAIPPLQPPLKHRLQQRPVATVLTPHPGEFRRLFPNLPDTLTVAQMAAELTGATIILKRARTAIATPTGPLWINPESTAALARGGSGDVLTGLVGGLLAQHQARHKNPPFNHLPPSPLPLDSSSALLAALGAVGWHAAAARYGAQQRTIFGVDPSTLAASLLPCLQSLSS